MKGTITAIHKMKWGNGTEFQRITFQMEDGSWAKTDLCPTYRNFRFWKDYLQIGSTFRDLALRDKKTVEADAKPSFSHRIPPPPEEPMLFEL